MRDCALPTARRVAKFETTPAPRISGIGIRGPGKWGPKKSLDIIEQ
jgi:hypothetical protein